MAAGAGGLLSRKGRLLLPVLAAGALAACGGPEPPPRSEAAPSCEDAGAARVVERLGERMKEVSLLASDTVVVREIREAYAPLVTPELLAAWVADPSRAPGREVSSPWPERIEVLAVAPAQDGTCRVEGEVVYVTSAEATGGGAAARAPVVLRVVEDDGWRVGAFEAGAPPAADAPTANSPAAEAAAVIRRYYEAIAARDFRRAYALWAGGGAASGQSFEEFAAGFARTARVEVEVGEPGRVEGAAGSRYVEIPVVIRAETADGEAQRFEGSYTLRRGVVDGASEEERHWRIHAADVERTG